MDDGAEPANDDRRNRSDGESRWLAKLECVYGRLLAAWTGRDNPATRRHRAAALLERTAFVRLAQRARLVSADLLSGDVRPGERAAALSECFDWVRASMGDAVLDASLGGERASCGDSIGDDAGADDRGGWIGRFDGGALGCLVETTRPLADASAERGVPPTFLGLLHQRLVHACALGDAARRRGVYYTPAYVAQYMARRAVEECRLESRIDGRLRILDPACGCGAFLVAAWQARASDAPDGLSELYGIDSDPAAVVVARRTLLLGAAARGCAAPDSADSKGRIRRWAAQLGRRIRWGNALDDEPVASFPDDFDVVVGNPPYHRELGGKDILDALAGSRIGRRHRTARMDLWHYFLHRGLEWLAPGGALSYIVPAYWVAGRSGRGPVEAIRNTCRIAEVFLLEDRRVFQGVSGRHLILTVVREPARGTTWIRRPAPRSTATAAALLSGAAAIRSYPKRAEELFVDGGLRLEESRVSDEAFRGCSALAALAAVRQGIVENPAAISRKAFERHRGDWALGEGVFALRPEEVERLDPADDDRALLRPYHDLSDLGRYFLAAQPSATLIYATAATWPDIARHPRLRDHLARFRPILEERRETRSGRRAWWHLHWPRDPRIWQTPKIVAVQMGVRPAFAFAADPVWVPFSVNVAVPRCDVPEHPQYLTALLNSRLAWDWFLQRAKHRGVGLEINGHVLERFPVRRIRWDEPAERGLHDALVALATERAGVERSLRSRPDTRGNAECGAGETLRRNELDEQIDRLVASLYGVSGASP
jgi:adenine-specific DNA-methyltransferase